MTKFRSFVLILLPVVSLLNVSPASGQLKYQLYDPMERGAYLLNFGFGPGINYYSGYPSGFGPSFQVSFETGMWELGPGVISLGAETGFSYFSYGADYTWYESEKEYTGKAYNYQWYSMIGAARAAYHYGWNIKGLDTYGGFALGMRFLIFSGAYYNNYTPTGYDPASVSPFVGAYLGGSYFFNKFIGINAEFGYNITWAQFGMVILLN
jgi:hypothetical protein